MFWRDQYDVLDNKLFQSVSDSDGKVVILNPVHSLTKHGKLVYYNKTGNLVRGTTATAVNKLKLKLN